MECFATHTGLVLPLDRIDVDTDQMVPKQFCKFLTRSGYGRVLFYDWRYQSGEQPDPAFVMNWPRYQGASILLSRANFGCGSSREHAVWACCDFGFRVIIASSYAEIFYNNCFKNGLLPVTLEDGEVEELFRLSNYKTDYRLTVNLEKQTIEDQFGLQFAFSINSFRRDCLLRGIDEIDITMAKEDRIAAYERSRNDQSKLYGSLD